MNKVFYSGDAESSFNEPTASLPPTVLVPDFFYKFYFWRKSHYVFPGPGGAWGLTGGSRFIAEGQFGRFDKPLFICYAVIIIE